MAIHQSGAAGAIVLRGGGGGGGYRGLITSSILFFIAHSCASHRSSAVLLVAGATATHPSTERFGVITPQGHVETGTRNGDAADGDDRLDLPLRFIEVSSPSHLETFDTSDVKIVARVRGVVGGGTPTDVCITQVVDPNCFGFAEKKNKDEKDGSRSLSLSSSHVAAVEKARRVVSDERTIRPSSRHCFPLPFSGRVKIPATCHLFGIEAVRRGGGGKGEAVLLESTIHAARVDTVDDKVFFRYPTTPALHGWGEVGMVTESVRRMGPGLVLEFGTGSGDTTVALSKFLRMLLLRGGDGTSGGTGGGKQALGLALSDGTIHTFDSFRGLPEDWRPGFPAGMFRSARDGAPDFDVPFNAIVHAGMVQDTLEPFLVSPTGGLDAPLGLIHFDLTVHSSTLYVLDAIACRLSGGTIVVFHQFFNYFDWSDTRGERTAWLEAVEKHGIEYEEIGYVSTMYMVKITGVPTECRKRLPERGGGTKSKDEEGTEEVNVDKLLTYDGEGSRLPSIDPAVREQSLSALNAAGKKYAKDDDEASFIEALERIVSIDPFCAEALGFLATAMDDPARISERMDYARRALLLQHAPPDLDGEGGAKGMDALELLASLRKTPSFEQPFERKVMKHRLRHDLEQLRYIRSKRLVLPPQRSLIDKAIVAYNTTLIELGGASTTSRNGEEMVTLTWAQWKRIGPYFNRALHIPPAPRSRPGVGNVGGLNASAVNFDAVVSEYKEKEKEKESSSQSTTSAVVVVDDVLSDSTLETLLRYYREATVFYSYSHRSYVGTYLPDGLGNHALAQVVEEISYKLRDIICDRPLVQAWVYKYDERLNRGINIHADVAAVNINIWLSPNNSADEDRTGGLVVYTRKPPDDWDFRRFNTDPTPREVLDMLEESGWANVTVPYRQNRMVVFDSKLFHVSDVGRWKSGYERRRINLTLLFGRMGSSCES